MRNKFNHLKIDKKYKKILTDEINEIKNKKKEELICISMFPYPSGKLHMGHIRNYLINDIVCRYTNIKGEKKSIMYFGWDSFGLPTENASIENNISPLEWTKANIKYMKNQLENCNFLIDWEFEINTCKEEYYKWSQFFFCKFASNGFIYKRKYMVNWDPKDKTVLADEQVINKRGWRSGVKIVKKPLDSYFIKISKLRKYINKETDNLNWPDSVKSAQKNWIGEVKLFYCKMYINNKLKKVYFDNIYSPICKNEVFLNKKKYYKHFVNKKEKNKNKVKIETKTGKYYYLKVNFFNKEDKYYKYNIIFLKRIGPIKKKYLKNIIASKYNIGKRIKFFLYLKFKIKKEFKYKIRDWCISRQRTWGTPIPIKKCNKCKKEILNTNIPIKIGFKNKTKVPKFEKCNKCKGRLINIKETLDTFFDSSWYIIMYLCKKRLSKKSLLDIPSVDIYIGGREHEILHLLYLRIFFLILRKIKLIKIKKPIKKLITQGMVLKKEKGKASKMSKSKGGNIDPIELISKYGSDCLRMYIAFSGPIQKDFIWDSFKINGCYRYINKLWKFFVYRVSKIGNVKFESYKKLDKIHNSILRSYKDMKYNLVISGSMKIFNFIKKKKLKKKENIVKIYFLKLISLLNPICPAISCIIWKTLTKKRDNFFNDEIRKYFFCSSKKEKILKVYINGNLKFKGKKKGSLNYNKYKFIKKYNINNISRIIVKKNIINFLTTNVRK
ncbi:class I tRNA ligase family protein [Candidatus Vidania fulgoroideorum]